MFFFVMAILLAAAGGYLVHRFHKIDKRWGNKYKIACSLICGDLFSTLGSKVYIFQQLLGHNVILVTSLTGFFNRTTLLMSYMFFLSSLLDILEMSALRKARILRLGLYLAILYAIEMIAEILYSKFCTGRPA